MWKPEDRESPPESRTSLPVVVGRSAGPADLDAFSSTNGPAGRKQGVPGRPPIGGRLIGDAASLIEKPLTRAAIAGDRSAIGYQRWRASRS